MIKSFRHKGLKDFFENGSKRGISSELAARIGRRLDVLNAAQQAADLDAHGFTCTSSKETDMMSGRFRLAAIGVLLFDLQKVKSSMLT